MNTGTQGCKNGTVQMPIRKTLLSENLKIV